MRVLVCPDKFRGSLSAREAIDAIRVGLVRVGTFDIDPLPLADGGEGTLESLVDAMGGAVHEVDTIDAIGRPLSSPWALLSDGTAVVESATSVGLALLGGLRDPMEASSQGLGRVIAAALANRPRRLLVTVGGVATTDGGLGCLDELGWDLRGVETTVACDVQTTFVDAARVFGPQKGADAHQVVELTERLRRLAERYATETIDIATMPGTGAAGGIAGGLAALGAQLTPGFSVVAKIVGLSRHLGEADVVVTGEGRLDETSLSGKVVGGVLDAAEGAAAKRVVLAGSGDATTVRSLEERGVRVSLLRSRARSDADSLERAGELLAAVAEALAAALIGSNEAS